MNRVWLLHAGRTLATLWAAFWVWFVVMDVLSEPSPTAYKVLAGSLTFLALVVLTIWQWPLVGGCLAIAAGCSFIWLIATHYLGTDASRLMVLLVLALPPLLAGILVVAGADAGPKLDRNARGGASSS